ncbi:Sir2 family NAD-dependent protein deacetylase [Vibrio crassostreae]|uniref:Sir2 family NAD-dependent protein deacetylase n=1 Tax=Vibrio crassostreae TaxID=246167 RepID=UPI001B307C7A|nr:Sir2 family NAD-dependent protein deacetylase [Vibrio crassostreae]
MELDYFTGKKVMFVCGAGLGVASGLPTYYGANGIYKELEKEFGMSIEDALSETMFKHNPAIVWNHIRKIASSTTGAKPNIGHEKIREICRVADEAIVVTQNVDGLQQLDNQDELYEIHGSGKTATCTECESVYKSPLEINTTVPTCEVCKTALKPDVVLFEGYPKFKGQYDKLCDFAASADILICVGTQVAFPYVADLLNHTAHGKGIIHWVDIEQPDFTMSFVDAAAVNQAMFTFTEGAEEYFGAIA